ncbi:hypothetical protein HPB48_026414 [Haemaphysalis longicornis]|uniref:Uncharacterized protein n=1 Tax=Haemaphysalis longicornis TaxID=44386 RepID=A0A9J6H129_HAELO|nr:hypothetical protein HPB48_026414 [Haemaphysalis longicornis]
MPPSAISRRVSRRRAWKCSDSRGAGKCDGPSTLTSFQGCKSKNRPGKTNDGWDVGRSRVFDQTASEALQCERRVDRSESLSGPWLMTLLSKPKWRLREKSRGELYQQARRHSRGSSPLKQLKRCELTVASTAERALKSAPLESTLLCAHELSYGVEQLGRAAISELFVEEQVPEARALGSRGSVNNTLGEPLLGSLVQSCTDDVCHFISHLRK